MRIVIQKVSKASVIIEGKQKSAIKSGLLILLGVEDSDTQEDINWLVKKVSQLRIFNDKSGQMNLSIQNVDGDILVVSQFTLHASTKKGNRPSYIRASKPDFAIPMYEEFIDTISQAIGKPVASGEFGAMMEVSLINNGPVTIIIDSKQRDF